MMHRAAYRHLLTAVLLLGLGIGPADAFDVPKRRPFTVSLPPPPAPSTPMPAASVAPTARGAGSAALSVAELTPSAVVFIGHSIQIAKGAVQASLGRGAMASGGAGRRDLSATHAVLNPALPGHGLGLGVADGGALAAAGAAFKTRDGLGTRRRLRVDLDASDNLHLAAALSDDGSEDMAVAYSARAGAAIDMAAAAAVGIDANADDAWRLDASLSLLNRATGWNLTLAGAGEAHTERSGDMRVYAKVGRRWTADDQRTVALGIDTGVARAAGAAAATAGIGGRLGFANHGHAFIGCRVYGTRDGASGGLAQRISAGGALFF